MRKLVNSLLVLYVIFCLSTSWGAVENLDEMIARKARLTQCVWGHQYLEDSNNHYLWQPETLCYIDVITGHEVWRLSNTPGLQNFYHDDIGFSPWSADGKRLAFVSNRDTGAFNREGYRIWMIVNTDGSFLRPIINGPSRVYAHTPFFHWSPQIPDVYYEFGRSYANNSGKGPNVLYKAFVSDFDVTCSPLIIFPTNHGSELCLKKTISGDGRKIIAMPWNESWWYPATIYPDSSAALDDPDGYTVDRNMDSQWGDTPESYSSLHDQYYVGDGTWIFILPSGSHAWWRIKVLGSATDGGSKYSFSPPNQFDEQWPENTVDWWGGENDPFGCDYWSHFAPDRWGRYALFSNVDANPIGPGVWDIKNHQWVVRTFGGGAQHHNWSGFTDWTVSSRGTGNDPNYLNDRIYIQKYNDPESQKVVCYTHTLYNNGGVYAGADYEYVALPRPAQSPDGTKVAFHSTFLNPKTGSYDNKPDIFWAVCYYPYPPVITGASKTQQGTVRITWNPPRYTTRGWPDEDSDPPPEPKEIKCYHVWVSEDNSTWNELTTTGVPFGTNYYDVHQPNNTTRYYAVTSEEYSRLESRTLSNTWKVTLDENGNIIESKEETPYPSDPGGIKPFWTTPPPAPTNFTVVKQSTPGHYLLTWTEPQDSKIRYYNIYYSTEGEPPIDQRYRIASVPVGTSKWLDWCADPNAPAYYRITSVDRYGNESGVNQPPGEDYEPPSVPTNLTATTVLSSEITLSWSASTDNVGVAGYKIYRNGNFIANSTTTSYTDTGLSPSTTYTYAVSAYDTSGNESQLSETISVTTQQEAPSQTITLIHAGDTWKYLKGTADPPSGWNSIAFDDSSWLEGATGIGYGDGDDATVLSDMQNNYLTIYTRKLFEINNLSNITQLILSIDYDDGFIAYINGQEVARVNMTGEAHYNTPASGYHEAGNPQTFDISQYINILKTGTNVLAVEVHNASIDSSDLSFIPELSITCTENSNIPPPPTINDIKQ